MIDYEFYTIVSFLGDIFSPFISWFCVGLVAAGIIASIFYIWMDLLRWLTRERG